MPDRCAELPLQSSGWRPAPGGGRSWRPAGPGSPGDWPGRDSSSPPDSSERQDHTHPQTLHLTSIVLAPSLTNWPRPSISEMHSSQEMVDWEETPALRTRRLRARALSMMSQVSAGTDNWVRTEYWARSTVQENLNVYLLELISTDFSILSSLWLIWMILQSVQNKKQTR